MRRLAALFGSSGEKKALRPYALELSKTEFQSRRTDSNYASEIFDDFRIARAAGATAANPSDPLNISEPGFNLLFAAVALSGTAARILDFGGGLGHHGNMLSSLLPIESYVVIELEPFVRRIESIRSPQIEYLSDIPARPFDVVFSSGTLQYTDAPLEYFRRLIEVDAASIVLTRNFCSSSPRYFEQHAPLFDHGWGPIPPGFENRDTVMFAEAVERDKLVSLATEKYQLALISPNESGMIAHDDGLFGGDFLFRRKRGAG